MEYNKIFTPGSPPTSSDLLVGREEVLDKLRSYLKSPGIHPLVVGPRGIGKTSVVKKILSEYSLTVHLEANLVSNFDELARAICFKLGVETEILKSSSESSLNSGGGFNVQVFNAKMDAQDKASQEIRGIAGKTIEPWLFYHLLIDGLSGNALISLEELDDVSNKTNIKGGLVKLAKSIASKSDVFHHKFLFSGVGKDSHDLFGEHMSVHRSFPLVYLKDLTTSDFISFFGVAEKLLGIQIPDLIKKRIAEDADGFPYYVHLIGYHLLDQFHKDSRAKHIEFDHYNVALDKAYEDAFMHLLFKYKFTIYKLDEIEKHILNILVNGRNSIINKEDLLKKIKNSFNHKEDEVKDKINELVTKEYLAYRKSDNILKINDPLLKPFLRDKLNLRKRELLKKQMNQVQLNIFDKSSNKH